MKYLKLGGLSCAMALLWSGLVMAELYVEFGGGMNVRGAHQSDVIGTVEIGVDTSGPLRFGLQFSERVDRQSVVALFDPCKGEDVVSCTEREKWLVDIFDSSTAAAIAMGYFDFGDGRVSTYLGAGAGFIIEADHLDKPAGQVAAGVTFRFNDLLAVSGEYTHFSDFDGNDSGGAMVKLRRTF